MSVSVDEGTGRWLQEAGGEWPALVEALDAASTEKCVDCDYQLGGLLGTFTWGIANGQGHCSQCGFPYLYYHRFERPPGPKGPRTDVVLLAFVPLAELPVIEEVVPGI